jgi:hypothetical protein
MELAKLYDMADKENISIINFKMKNKAIICEIDKEYYIGLNYSNFDNSREEKEILAEELGHYYCNALYDINSDEETIMKKEYRARKWAFSTLAPASSLLKLEEEGCQYSYQVAEELGVSEELVNTAYNYYKENNYI